MVRAHRQARSLPPSYRTWTFLLLSFLVPAAPTLAGEPGVRALRCQRAFTEAGRTLATARLEVLQRCTTGALSCVEERPGDAACLAAVASRCRQDLARLEEDGGAVAAFRARIAADCAGVTFEELVGPEGLGHGASSCAVFGVPELRSLEDVRACAERQHACRSGQLLVAEVPRAAEMLELLGIDPEPGECIEHVAEGKGRGLFLPKSKGSSKKGKKRKKARKKLLGKKKAKKVGALVACQQGLAASGEWYVREYAKRMHACLEHLASCGQDDEACLAEGGLACETWLADLETGEGLLDRCLVERVEGACSPGDGGARRGKKKRRKKKWSLTTEDLLASTGLGFRAAETRCKDFGVPALDSLPSIADCVAREHACRAQQLVVRQVPRAPALLEAAGIDVSRFPCLLVEIGAVCGNGELDFLEECDPPGAPGQCGAGFLCDASCHCAGAAPPILEVEPRDVTVGEGEEVVLAARATDPDGERIVLSSSPRLAGASFEVHAGTEAHGTFRWRPGLADQGVHHLVFTARDERGLVDRVTVTLTVHDVNHAPSIEAPAEVVGDEGTVLTVQVVATDPDGDPVTIEATGLPDGAIFVPATGTLTFAPGFDQAGEYEISFSATDGSLRSETVTTVISVEDVPVGGPGSQPGLQLEVDDPENPTLLPTLQVTGRVNASGEEPVPPRLTSGLVSELHPAVASQGETLDVTIVGLEEGDHATHFVAGESRADFGPGTEVLDLVVEGPARAVARVVVAPEAPVGPHRVTVSTGRETAVAVVAFMVERGRATIRGVIVDAVTGEPLGGASISLLDEVVTTRSGEDGAFELAGVPGGSHTVVVRAADHGLLRLPVDAPVGDPVDLGILRLFPDVYDPEAPAGPSLHSVLGRGVADLSGRLTVEEARATIRDTLVLVGGTQAGVLDAYGNQLNPRVEGFGLMSLDDRGVDLYATRMAKGETVPLVEVLAQVAFGFEWAGSRPPTLPALLGALQDVVDRAWQRPNDPAAALPIAVFNRDGRHLAPNPPLLSADTLLNRFQAFLLVNSFMAETGRRLERRHASMEESSRVNLDEDGTEDNSYTATWSTVLETLGAEPTAPASDSVGGGSSLPDFDRLLQDYYLDHSAEALARMREMLLEKFPGYGLEEMFAENPWGVQEAWDELLRISEHDLEVRRLMEEMVHDVNPGLDDQNALWGALQDMHGAAYEAFFKYGQFPADAKLTLLRNTFAPETPVIYRAFETTTEIGPPGSGVRVPAVKIVFYRSGSDAGPANPPDVDFHYRLWRLQPKGGSELDVDPAMPGGSDAQLVMVGFGRIEEPARDAMAPRPAGEGWPARTAMFVVPLPPAGMNVYRVDVIRRRGKGSVLDELDPTSPEFRERFRPWLAGYVEPQEIDPTGRLGGRTLQPGQGWFHSYTYEISPLSNAASVWVAAPGSIGRVDLAADYHDPSKIYVSLPDVRKDETSRGCGVVLRYDARTAEMEEFLEPGFLEPGQAGLAIDDQWNLYMDNAASDAAYGGRVFRFLGWRSPGDPERPAELSSERKLFVGEVAYWSRMLQRAHPVSVRAMTMGPASSRGVGPALYVAEGMSNEIRRIAVQAPEFHGWDPWHNVGEGWAINVSDMDPADALAFTWFTDLAFDRRGRYLYVGEGSRVVRTPGGKGTSRSIARGGTFFANASGVAVCESRDGEVLFVSDLGPAGASEGVIWRIPVEEIPLDVPDDPVERNRFLSRYLFLRGLDHPGRIRITDGGNAFVFADAKGLRYQRFGFTGRAIGEDGSPLAGAVVTIRTLAGTRSTVADADGYYHFSGTTEKAEATVYATITHPDRTYMERISLVGSCNANVRPAPCVSIDHPADGTWIAAENVTVTGTIFPRQEDYMETRVVLEVTHDGETTSYPVSWTGHDNDFVVRDVPLAPGDNFLVVRADPLGAMGPGSSLTTIVRRTSVVPSTQAAAGIVVDDEGDPRDGVEVLVRVDGEPAATVITDACGYWEKQGLPPGEVTWEVVEEDRR